MTLKVEQRDTKIRPEVVREEGKVPAVLYGRKEESTPISINAKQFETAWKKAGESTIISLEGVGDDKESLIQDVAKHPVSGEVLHADFYVIEKGKKLHVNVPLEFVGESPAIKGLGGTLVKVLHELEIEALPRDLIHEIKVDISSLVDFEGHISVKDLSLPEGVTALAEPEDVVASVAEPREEEEEEPVEEVDMDAIEVEGKGKEEGEETPEDNETPSE